MLEEKVEMEAIEDSNNEGISRKNRLDKYCVLESRLGWLYSKFKPLQLRAIKLGITPPDFKIIELFTKSVSSEYGKYDVRFAHIELIGETPKLGDYEFCGTIEHGEKGNIVRMIAKMDIDPSPFYFGKQECDHCKKKRARVNTYIVRKDQEVFRIGKSCMKDFLGHRGLEVLAWLASMEEALEEASREDRSPRAADNKYEFLTRVIELSIASYNARGWVSSKSTKTSTSEDVKYHLYTSAEKMKLDEVSPYDINEDIISQAKITIDHYKNIETQNSFEHNLKVVAQMEFVEFKHINLAVVMIRSFLRSKEIEETNRLKKAEYEARNAARSRLVHVGVIKERIELQLKVKTKIRIDSQFSALAVLIKFEDKDGNQFCWFTTGGEDYEVEKEYHVKATIKAHDVFRETKQTMITRCKIVTGEEKPEKKSKKKASVKEAELEVKV